MLFRSEKIEADMAIDDSVIVREDWNETDSFDESAEVLPNRSVAIAVVVAVVVDLVKYIVSSCFWSLLLLLALPPRRRCFYEFVLFYCTHKESSQIDPMPHYRW